MTIEEKRAEIKKYCMERFCTNCLLNERLNCYQFATNAEIESNYRLVFGDDNTESESVNIPVVENDRVNHPSHYNDGKIEVIEYIEDKNLDFCLGNAVKYISRAGKKNKDKEVEDLKKAIWYIDRRIKQIERAPEAISDV